MMNDVGGSGSGQQQLAAGPRELIAPAQQQQQQRAPISAAPTAHANLGSAVSGDMAVGEIFETIWAFRQAFRIDSARFPSSPEDEVVERGEPSAAAATAAGALPTSPRLRGEMIDVGSATAALRQAPGDRERRHIRALAEIMASSYILRKLPSETREALCRVSSLVEMTQGCCVYGRGDVPDGIYFILQGSVDLVMLEDKEPAARKEAREDDEVVKSRSLLSTLGPGQVFGEAALSGRGETRSATARVTSPSLALMCLSAADYHAVMRAIRAEDVLKMLEMEPAGRSEEHLSVIDAAMSGTDLGFDQWKNLVPEVRARYCRALTLRKYDGGETIYGNGSGETCDGVMVILDGAVEVTNPSLSIPHIKGRKHKKDGPDAAKHSHRRSSLNNMMTEIKVTHQFTALKETLKGSKGSPRGRGGDASGESEEDSGVNDSRESGLDTSMASDSSRSPSSNMSFLPTPSRGADDGGKEEQVEDHREIVMIGDWFGDFSGLGDASMAKGKNRGAHVVKQSCVVLLPRAEHLLISQEVADKEAESRRTLLDNALWAQPTLGHDFLGKLSALLTRKVLSQGDIVAKQGAAVEEIYFVDEGELLVTVDLHCIRSPASAGAVAQSEGMSTPRGGAATKRLPLASAVRFDCLGLLETLGKYGWCASYTAQGPSTTVLAGNAHKLMALLDRVIESSSGRMLVESKARARAEGAKGGLAMLQAKGWLPHAAEASLVQHLTRPETGLKRDGDLKSSSQTPSKQPILTQRKPQVSTPPHAPPSASTFRLHLAEVTGIVVQERVTERARPPRTAVMRQIGLFAPPDPLRYSQGRSRNFGGSTARSLAAGGGRMASSSRGGMPAWLSPRAPMLNQAGYVRSDEGFVVGQGPTGAGGGVYFEREAIYTPMSISGGKRAATSGVRGGMSWGRVYGGDTKGKASGEGEEAREDGIVRGTGLGTGSRREDLSTSAAAAEHPAAAGGTEEAKGWGSVSEERS